MWRFSGRGAGKMYGKGFEFASTTAHFSASAGKMMAKLALSL